MFAKHKPRPKADEPLVPHGLVWQATAEAGTLEKSDREAAKVSPPARPIQIVPPAVEVAGSATPAVTRIAKKPAGSSPPLFWQKVTKPEIVKPVANTAGSESSPAEFARVQPAASNDNTEVARPDVHPTGERPALAMVRRRLGSVSRRISEQRRAVARVVVDLRKVIGVLGRMGVAWFERVRAKTLEGYQPVELRSTGYFSAVRARNVVVGLWTRSAAGIRSVVNLARVPLRRVHALRAVEQPMPAPDPESTIRGRGGIRIRLTGLPLQSRIALTRLLSEWKLNKHRSRRDSQLWISMAIAAVCALLALALISTARRYATESLPSHLSHAGWSPVSNSPPTVSAAPLKPTARRVQAVRAVSKPLIVERKRVNTAPAIKPKPKRSGDDDYVARDTYVYYGNKPNGSH